MQRRDALKIVGAVLAPMGLAMNANSQLRRNESAKVVIPATPKPQILAEFTPMPIRDENGNIIRTDPSLGELTLNLDTVTVIKVRFGNQIHEITPNDLMLAFLNQ